MAEISDDMIEGRCCSLCGKYFTKEHNIDGADVPVFFEHGYPVACDECWDETCGYEKQDSKAETY